MMRHTNIFVRGHDKKRYKIVGLIDSNLPKAEIDDILDLLGFYMYSVTAEDEIVDGYKKGQVVG